MNVHGSVLSDQRAVEKQVDFVVFAEPCSVNVEAVAGVEDHHVVGQSNKDEEDQSTGHQPGESTQLLCHIWPPFPVAIC